MDLNSIAERAYQNDINKGFEIQHIAISAMLIVTELAELVEGHRKQKGIENIGEELADVILRTAILARHLNIDLEKEIETKMIKNESRSYRHGGKLY